MIKTTLTVSIIIEHWDEPVGTLTSRKCMNWDLDLPILPKRVCWAQLEPEEGRYDFTWLDRAVALAAKV